MGKALLYYLAQTWTAGLPGRPSMMHPPRAASRARHPPPRPRVHRARGARRPCWRTACAPCWAAAAHDRHIAT